MILLCVVLAASPQNLVAYVQSRTELSVGERDAWDKALRMTFGGSAMRADNDDAIGAARSVISYGIFNRLDPVKVMTAAYDAKNDSLAFVPPPMAIKYQQLVLMGRRPKESARYLAFNFPRYFDEELAPEMVGYWQKILDNGTAVDPSRVERQLKETREKMRPQLRDLTKRAAELERNLGKGLVTRGQVQDALVLARQDVVLALGAIEGNRPFMELFERLSRELNLKAELAPEPPPPVQPDEQPPAQPPTPPPAPKTARKKQAKAVSPKEIEQPPVSPPLADGWRALPSAIEHWLGTPYLWGGADRNGIDCSGFSREVYREAQSYELPRVAGQQYMEGVGIDRPELRDGDLVFFDTLDRGRITHVGVYRGDGRIAHATTSRGVVYENLEAKWLQRAYRGARRIK